MSLEIADHKLISSSEAVRFAKTPNVGGALVAEGIVLHDTAGRLDMQTSVDWLCNKTAKASAHFVVGTDGEIVQLAPLNKQTWHAGSSAYQGRKGCNKFSFGIEIVNPGRLKPIGGGRFKAWFKQTYSEDDFEIRHAATPEHGAGHWMDYAEPQVEAVTRLCRALVDEYECKWITTHWQVSPGRKIDPNPLFPVDHVRARALGRGSDEGDEPTVIANTNHRRWPSYADNVEQVIPRGSEVEILRSGDFANLGVQETWHLVNYDGLQGWVHGSLVS